MLKIANIQLQSGDDIDQNLTIIRTAIHMASTYGARLVVLPENACLMGSQTKLAARFDDVCHAYASLAKECGVCLVAGTLPCSLRPDGSATDGKLRQSSLVFDDNGNQIARYDKIHLFRANVADGVGSYDEGRTFEPGTELIVCPLMVDGCVYRIGLSVCFDLRFAPMFLALRHQHADIITAPAAFTYKTGKANWQTLIQARALDSQCLVVGAAQGGTHYFWHKGKQHCRKTWGHAMMADASGRIIAHTGRVHCTDDARGTSDFLISYAAFDKEAQEQIRRDMPIFELQNQTVFGNLLNSS